ncbi:Uncharacterized protein dnl_12750 [Desulfonema limicola]|uniref:Uncharacterized protein n=1 Tax=Desulfonema limicola TaxID=45656 RepID=A0A975B580_9BACT|nr:Uncharacterized protein dnl_12750 [Desulfonema limicola]
MIDRASQALWKLALEPITESLAKWIYEARLYVFYLYAIILDIYSFFDSKIYENI